MDKEMIKRRMAFREKIRNYPGNSEEYALKNCTERTDTILRGKKVLFLGSSVTVGACSREESFADDMAYIDGVIKIKEAVSGTTLVWDASEKESYIERMSRLDPLMEVDLFICQLSTNDATKNKPLGAVGDGTDRASFDVTTITGAMEYIIAYVRETWHCPIWFYTGTKYDNAAYESMVSRLYELAEKWEIGVIDLWNNDHMNAVTSEEYALYMADPIHPTRAGYLTWWYPEMKRILLESLK